MGTMDGAEQQAAYQKALGNAIRTRRKAMGWTLRHMVVAHGFHLSAFNGHESGRLGLSLPTLLRVAKALELRPSELLAAAEAQLEVVQELGEGNSESASKKLHRPESDARAAAFHTADVTAVHSEKSR